ncbi:hypothetical protein CSC17_5184 [Klebsiella oxytoca]|nr:hypothetical protein CSC17_5184 [Klebsiella oxytoca]
MQQAALLWRHVAGLGSIKYWNMQTSGDAKQAVDVVDDLRYRRGVSSVKIEKITLHIMYE